MKTTVRPETSRTEDRLAQATSREHDSGPSLWLSYREAAAKKGVHPDTISKWATKGKIHRSDLLLRVTAAGLRFTSLVWWPDVAKIVVYSGRGDHKPVCDTTWARFCKVWAEFVVQKDDVA